VRIFAEFHAVHYGDFISYLWILCSSRNSSLSSVWVVGCGFSSYFYIHSMLAIYSSNVLLHHVLNWVHVWKLARYFWCLGCATLGVLRRAFGVILIVLRNIKCTFYSFLSIIFNTWSFSVICYPRGVLPWPCSFNCVIVWLKLSFPILRPSVYTVVFIL